MRKAGAGHAGTGAGVDLELANGLSPRNLSSALHPSSLLFPRSSLTPHAYRTG